jgi:hypothetical protein
MPRRRFGVAMSALKARIVDMVARGGEDGTLCSVVYHCVFRDHHGSRARLKAHVWQINELLADEGYCIVAVRDHNQRHSADRYRLVRKQQRKAA